MGAAKTTIASQFGGKPFNSPNDVVVRSDGNIYFTDPDYGADPDAATPRQPQQSVFRIDPGGTGSLGDLTARAAAIVGARAATAYGETMASDFGYDLARAGASVVSGAAFGVDGAAHRGALAAGGPTIAVLACGVNVAYPAAHRRSWPGTGYHPPNARASRAKWNSSDPRRKANGLRTRSAGSGRRAKWMRASARVKS